MIEIRRRTPQCTPQFSSQIPPLLQRIYANRGVSTDDVMDRSAKRLLSFNKLHGIDEAVSLLADALVQNKRIIVVGDFDADGATSSALSVTALKMLGCTNCDYLVPNRFEDGYGLSRRW